MSLPTEYSWPTFTVDVLYGTAVLRNSFAVQVNSLGRLGHEWAAIRPFDFPKDKQDLRMFYKTTKARNKKSPSRNVVVAAWRRRTGKPGQKAEVSRAKAAKK